MSTTDFALSITDLYALRASIAAKLPALHSAGQLTIAFELEAARDHLNTAIELFLQIRPEFTDPTPKTERPSNVKGQAGNTGNLF